MHLFVKNKMKKTCICKIETQTSVMYYLYTTDLVLNSKIQNKKSLQLLCIKEVYFIWRECIYEQMKNRFMTYVCTK